MRDKGIRAAISAVLIAAAVSIPSAGLCARANSPGCEAVFSVICEEGYEKDQCREHKQHDAHIHLSISFQNVPPSLFREERGRRPKPLASENQ
jgi:hypothetical protein